MFVFVASTRNLFMFSHYLVLYLFLSHLVATFLASFLLALFVEVPFVRLELAIAKYFITDPEYGDRRKSSKYYYTVNPPLKQGELGDDFTAKKQLPLTEKYSIHSQFSVESSDTLITTANTRNGSQYSNSSSTSAKSSSSSSSSDSNSRL